MSFVCKTLLSTFLVLYTFSHTGHSFPLGETAAPFPSLDDEEDDELSCKITDEKPLRIECHHKDLSARGFLKRLFEDLLVVVVHPHTKAKRCHIEHFAWTPCEFQHSRIPTRPSALRIIKLCCKTLRVFVLDHAEFDADVLQYLTTMCPQLERLGARENVPLSLESGMTLIL